MLQSKKILIGITASIAAYKIILLVRLLIKAGAEVKIVMTPASKDFVSPLVLSTLSKNNVVIELSTEHQWANHVLLGRWADVFLIAPLSCNTLAKMANGQCDNLLLATYLSATCSVVVAPAMDEDMWHHATVKRNLQQLTKDGVAVIPVNHGELASGLTGDGRMAEPEELMQYLAEHYGRSVELQGKKILITAGPTYEHLDPVRFIGNHSSGKMGFALADELYMKGADVTVVAGPVSIKPQFKGIKVIHVTSAAEMYKQAMKEFKQVDVAIMAAAVADFTPMKVAGEKIKKGQQKSIQINLQVTQDILASVGAIKKKKQFLVGFALETNNELVNAQKKLTEKNADCIILNSLKNEGAGFGLDTNKISIVDKNGEVRHFETKSKKAVAVDIVSYIIQQINA